MPRMRRAAEELLRCQWCGKLFPRPMDRKGRYKPKYCGVRDYKAAARQRMKEMQSRHRESFAVGRRKGLVSRRRKVVEVDFGRVGRYLDLMNCRDSSFEGGLGAVFGGKLVDMIARGA